MSLHPAAIAVKCERLKLKAAFVALTNSLIELLECLTMPGGNQRINRLADNRILIVYFKHFQPGRIDLEQDTIWCNDFHTLRFGINNGSQAIFPFS